MSQRNLDIVILGLSITSSWGNGHAVTYRGLMRELSARGHRVLFLERDQPWYADNRDLPSPPYGTTATYEDLDELRRRWCQTIRNADVVMVGSYVPDGVDVIRFVLDNASGVRAFYDIDTPVTLGKLEREEYEYIEPESIPRFDLYLSFTGGPTLERLETVYGAQRARALYCCADPSLYRPTPRPTRWDLGYLGTYSQDRQPAVSRLLDAVAESAPHLRFIVAGPQYPKSITWAPNVQRIDHLPPREHPAFYGSQRLTLNVTRADMIRAGYSPSIRLFEAAACGTPIVTDAWRGLETIFTPGEEIFVADRTADVLELLEERSPAAVAAVGRAARRKLLSAHTATQRVIELEGYIREVSRTRVGRASRS
jgi:spore maturation protein CgeB